MAITTRNLGKLGGSVETREQAVNGTSYILLPVGWKKAVGVFTATKPSTGEVTVFNVPYTLASEAKINGGGVLGVGASLFRNVTGTITWYRLE